MANKTMTGPESAEKAKRVPLAPLPEGLKVTATKETALTSPRGRKAAAPNPLLPVVEAASANRVVNVFSGIDADVARTIRIKLSQAAAALNVSVTTVYDPETKVLKFLVVDRRKRERKAKA